MSHNPTYTPAWPIPARIPSEAEIRLMELKLEHGDNLDTAECWTLLRAVRSLQGRRTA